MQGARRLLARCAGWVAGSHPLVRLASGQRSGKQSAAQAAQPAAEPKLRSRSKEVVGGGLLGRHAPCFLRRRFKHLRTINDNTDGAERCMKLA